MRLVSTIAILLLLPLANAAAGDSSTASHAQATDGATRNTSNSICLMIESAAAANALPSEFFARVIWQESNFRSDAVGPLTRGGERALGIAQFMRRTADERQLLDPFDPVQALPKSAEFLRELRSEFGNLGLAAAAYNAGPQRVRNWLAGHTALPAQTQRYVEAVTGRSASEWAVGAVGQSASATELKCDDMVALLHRAPNPFVDELQRHVIAGVASPWGVQLAAGFSREHVLSSYSAIERQHSEILAGLDMLILSTTLRSRGPDPFYQVRIGVSTRQSANDLCARLHAAHVACMVLRNKA